MRCDPRYILAIRDLAAANPLWAARRIRDEAAAVTGYREDPSTVARILAGVPEYAARHRDRWRAARGLPIGPPEPTADEWADAEPSPAELEESERIREEIRSRKRRKPWTVPICGMRGYSHHND